MDKLFILIPELVVFLLSGCEDGKVNFSTVDQGFQFREEALNEILTNLPSY